MIEKDFIIESRSRDLGGFSVHRSLPSAVKRQLGPFVFLDHMGPLKIDSTHALDVRPHPHIGLATVTYLFEGRGLHRDSLGSKQIIEPGDLNWMTAGKGIVHSERSPQEDRDPAQKQVIHGVQIWVGLPKEFEECEPSFVSWPKNKMPEINLSQNLKAKLMLGKFQNYASPVKVLSPTLFMDFTCLNDTKEKISFDEKELGIFLISGQAKINNLELKPEDLIVIADPSNIEIDVKKNSRLIVIGGEPFPEPRFIWWNFVSTRRDRIKQAAELWKEQKMGQINGEAEFIPLPNTPFP
jgi:redox-sensitive bicupin YhaK (pirin superfamily)